MDDLGSIFGSHDVNTGSEAHLFIYKTAPATLSLGDKAAGA